MSIKPKLFLPLSWIKGVSARHVIQRGNNREACFFVETDFNACLAFLKDAAAKHHVAIHAFVLMTHHVHLLLAPSVAHGVRRMMQGLGRRYVQHSNFTHGRTGTLWEGRFKSTVVDAENYLLTVYRWRPTSVGRGGYRKSAEFQRARNPWH